MCSGRNLIGSQFQRFSHDWLAPRQDYYNEKAGPKKTTQLMAARKKGMGSAQK